MNLSCEGSKSNGNEARAGIISKDAFPLSVPQ